MLGIGALRDATLKPSFNLKHKKHRQLSLRTKKLHSLLHNTNVYTKPCYRICHLSHSTLQYGGKGISVTAIMWVMQV